MSSPTALHVELGERSYPIYIGSGILSQEALLSPYVQCGQILVVTNTVVAPLYLEKVTALLQRINPSAMIGSCILPDGESHKNLDTLNQVFDSLLNAAFNRKALIVALGGGVVGDMAGFAAACYQRGVPFIQMPTTLLSQVDSSVGGKTGVNHALGKNMIGAFYQPKAVVIDTSVLTTLPPRELSAGIAEVIKYGLIADEAFFQWLEHNMDQLLELNHEALVYAIRRSCELKAEVVAQDEHEGGIRAILNLGHTYGHAIETHMGYGTWLHGEAVSVGMLMACKLSCELGWIDGSVVERTRALLLRAKLPIDPPTEMNTESFLHHMKVDKKNLDGRIRLVLLKALGKAIVSSDYQEDLFLKQLNELQ